MKLLLVGSDYTWSIERHYLKYIRAINPDTRLFAAQNRLLYYLNNSLFNKISHRLGLSSVYKQINAELWKYIEEFKPDCIWVFKGMQVLPETLQNASQKGIKLVNYNPDNPFIFTGRGSGNEFISQSLSLYDLHFTYNREIQQQLIGRTHKPVKYLPFGYDLSQIDFNEIMKEPEIIKPCFLGNPDKDRATFIKELNRHGIHLDIFGNGWNRFISSSENTLYPAVYGPEFYKVLRRYRIQLNIMRIHNLQSHNMRTFEIPAVGGIQLAPDTPEHRAFFDAEKEILLYSSYSDCAQKMKDSLLFSEEKAKIIRQAAYNRSSISGYDYRSRAQFAFNEINTIS